VVFPAGRASKRDKCNGFSVELKQMKQKIHEKLAVAFAPQRLSVLDVSEKHANHQTKHGMSGTEETHFAITIVAELFAGRSRLQRHRMIYEVLVGILGHEIHALEITALTPDEENVDGKKKIV
jgi:BolA protein